jgi:DNA-binding CsgD family transcriptional regulator
MQIILEYAITAIVCLITAIVIQRIYKKEKKHVARVTEINGIMWFGFAIFIWGLGAFLNLIVVGYFKGSPDSRFLIYSGVLVSLLNSLFIILSLPSIEYEGRRSLIIQIVDRFSERQFIYIYMGVMGMLVFVFFATSYTNTRINNSLIWLIDIPISIVVACELLSALNKAFNSRSMRFMILPCFALFVLIVSAVTHRIVPIEHIPNFISQPTWILLGTISAISFKFLFILLFSILLYSWKFLSEKEEKQSLLEEILIAKTKLEEERTRLQLANDSHLDTISRLTLENNALTEASKIELSERQKEVLGNLGIFGNEKSYTEIAESMHISVDGFQTHIYQIKKALHISGSAGKNQLIQYAIENDLLKYATVKPTSKK